MTSIRQQVEAATEAKIERYFRNTHPELRPGRNFVYWNKQKDPDAEARYRNNYDRIFRRSGRKAQ